MGSFGREGEMLRDDKTNIRDAERLQYVHQ